jgi:hypothetical protein
LAGCESLLATCGEGPGGPLCFAEAHGRLRPVKRVVVDDSAGSVPGALQSPHACGMPTSLALSCGFYLPLPTQQGSEPQIGVGNADGDPAANQQQQPLQSVHDALVLSGLHTELHMELVDPLEADPLDPLPLLLVPLLAEPLLLVPLLAEPLLLEPLLAEPLLLEPLLAEPLLLEPLLAEPLLLEPLLPVPLLLEPLLPVPPPADPLLQAARPTVDEVPITTRTWNSLSIFMRGGIPRGKVRGPRLTVAAAESSTSRVA